MEGKRLELVGQTRLELVGQTLMGIGPRVWQTLGAKKTKLRSRQTSSGEKMRGRKSSCLGGGNEKKERWRNQGGCARTKSEATVDRWEEELRANFL